MPLIKILTSKETKQFDQAPVFTGEERKKYFRMTNLIQTNIVSFISPHTQVGFILHLGYFKATGRFFSAQDFHQNDVEYVINQLGFSPSLVNMKKYTRLIFHNHKKAILEMLGIEAFQKKKKDFESELNNLIGKHVKPRNVLFTMSHWLRVHKIEVPSYHLFASIITHLFNRQEKKLYNQLEKILTEKQKEVLDTLMAKSLIPPHIFKLTEFKYISQSEKPRKIDASVDLFLGVKKIFDDLLSSMEVLQLPVDTWRSYAYWVMTARSSQLKQFSNPYHRYLYLIAFVYHQYSYRQDCFIKILLNSTNKIKNDFKKHRQVVHFENKEHQEAYIQLTNQRKDCYQHKWEYTCGVLYNNSMNNDAKINDLYDFAQGQEKALLHLDNQLKELKKKAFQSDTQEVYLHFIQKNAVYLKNRVSGIIKSVGFNSSTSDESLIKAINNYNTLKDHAFCRSILPLFTEQEQKLFYNDTNKPKPGLCKAMFYIKVADGIKAGKLNLKHSYRYRSVEEYLIALETWKKNKAQLLERAGLTGFASFQAVIDKLKKELEKQYERSNNNILQGDNPHTKVNDKTRKVTVNTPGVDKPVIEPVADLMESFKFVPIGDILSDIDHTCDYMDMLQHRNIKRATNRPQKEVFTAGLIGYGCNIGLDKMGQISRGINESTLNNTAKWYFSEENLLKANDKIVEMTKQLPIYQLFKHHKEVQQTSSDGQKYNTAVESLNANYSFKYSGTGKGVSVYGFVDEAISTFYSTVISASEREATYVLDGLLHNEVYWEDDKEWLHHTDTHGVTEVIFAATNLLGVSLSPRIKSLKDQNIYSFEEPKTYDEKGYVLTPDGKIKTEMIEEQWDNILRVMTSIRLKESTASSIFSRLSSYAKQNPLYQAFKEMGKIYKSLFILKYYDELELRQLTEKQLNKVERSHQFAHAIFYDNNRQVKQDLKEEQDVAIMSRVIIQNAIILWNCLHLSVKLLSTKKDGEKAKMVKIIKGGSACTWQHINMQGIYEFKEESMSKFMKFEIDEILDMKIAA